MTVEKKVINLIPESMHSRKIKSITVQNTGSNHKNNDVKHSKTVDAKLTHKNLNKNKSVYYSTQIVRHYIDFTGNVL